ncbi:hypothetical protein OUZ56_014185 [Daphnia magna]|uniref:Uncharacterized protein n=1 Tax=Daphnia magna TaxID=35525 RepID=A0ABQ9Z824_9CRUS|nr:hypothetical protein OUZ56_014185 [Daphnia magna]
MLTGREKAKSCFKLCVQLILCCVTLIAILSAGIISKGSICFIISSMSRDRTVSNDSDSLYQHAERFASWSIFFSFEVSELFGFLQSLHAVGLHGVLITNCLYLIPVLFNFLSRKPDKPKRVAKMTMDGFAFLSQLTGCLHWTLI